MSTLTHYLGRSPKYLGWVLVDDRQYGFVFEGSSTRVMVTWAHAGLYGRREVWTRRANCGCNFRRRCHSEASFPVRGNGACCGAPPAIVARARANKSLPFPWGGDYTGVKSVSVTMGSPNVEKGLHQLSADATSAALNLQGGPRDCSRAGSQTFTVDPNFLSYTTEPITITAVLSRLAAGDNAGFNLKYESTSGWKGADGWYTIPEDNRWHAKTWTITDPQFVGKWGFNFTFDSDGTQFSKYQLRSVTVTKVPARQVAAPKH